MISPSTATAAARRIDAVVTPAAAARGAVGDHADLVAADGEVLRVGDRERVQLHHDHPLRRRRRRADLLVVGAGDVHVDRAAEAVAEVEELRLLRERPARRGCPAPACWNRYASDATFAASRLVAPMNASALERHVEEVVDARRRRRVLHLLELRDHLPAGRGERVRRHRRAHPLDLLLHHRDDHRVAHLDPVAPGAA